VALRGCGRGRWHDNRRWDGGKVSKDTET